MHSTNESEKAIKDGANQTLWSLTINAGDEGRDSKERDTGRAWYESGRKLLMEHLKNDGGQMWAARTPGAIDLWLVWAAALLQPDCCRSYLCSNTGKRLPLTGRGAEAQTGLKDFVVRGTQSPGDLLLLSVMSAHTFTSIHGHLSTSASNMSKKGWWGRPL